MRKIYLLLNIIFIASITLLLNAYSERLQAAQKTSEKKAVIGAKVVKKKTLLPVKKKPVPTVNYIATLSGSNLFEENRGQEAEEVKTAPPGQKLNLKLMGVCQVGALKGAIIINNNNRKQDDSSKSFFTIGEDIGDGYKLYDVTEKTAIIKSGTKKVELELEKVESTPAPPVVRRPDRTTRRYRRR
jgi:hypothetical protein